MVNVLQRAPAFVFNVYNRSNLEYSMFQLWIWNSSFRWYTVFFTFSRIQTRRGRRLIWISEWKQINMNTVQTLRFLAIVEFFYSLYWIHENPFKARKTQRDFDFCCSYIRMKTNHSEIKKKSKVQHSIIKQFMRRGGGVCNPQAPVKLSEYMRENQDSLFSSPLIDQLVQFSEYTNNTNIQTKCT